MAIELNHTIVPARDPKTSAQAILTPVSAQLA